MKTGFIGAGKVGCSLGKYLSTKGIDVAGYHDQDRKAAEEAAKFTETKVYADPEELIADCDVLFLTVPDGLIPHVFEEISDGNIQDKLICHCSGSISSAEAFPGAPEKGAFRYSVHPLFAVSDRFTTYRELADAFFTMEGDPERIEEMEALLAKAGLRFKVIPPEEKRRYHLAAAIVSNLVLALVDTGLKELEVCGFGAEEAREAVTPLAEGNLRHALADGPARALTGPVERGDTETLRKHLACLDKEEDRELYRLLSYKLLALAREKNPDRDYSEMEKFLKDASAGTLH